MIRKKSLLSFTLFSLILSGTVSLCAQAAPDTQDFARRKTAGERIVSGIGHTTLLVPSIVYVSGALGDFSPKLKIAFGALATRGIFGGVKGVYHAIAKPEVASEEPTSLSIWTAADSALIIPSLFILKEVFDDPDPRIVKLFFSLPAVYGLGTSLKTIYKLSQNRGANSDAREPEMHATPE